MTAPIGSFGPSGIVSPYERVAQSAAAPAEGGPSFGDLLGKALNDASDMQTESKDMIGAFLRGEPVELHQVMAASEEASISLELLVEMRNKLTDAYRTVMSVST